MNKQLGLVMDALTHSRSGVVTRLVRDTARLGQQMNP
jgi:hypothetical protein